MGAEFDKIDHLEEKLRMIQNTVEKLRENEERKERLERKELLEKIKEKREAAVLRRETTKKEKLKKEEMIKRRWEMLEWLTNFLEENQEKWEKEKKVREEENRIELEKWEKAKRLEKLKSLTLSRGGPELTVQGGAKTPALHILAIYPQQKLGSL